MEQEELEIWGIQGENKYPCIKKKERENKTEAFTCEIKGLQNDDIEQIEVNLNLALLYQG